MKNKKENLLKSLISFFIIIVAILLIIVVVLSNNDKSKNLSDEQIEIDTQKQEDENSRKAEENVIISKLSGMGERDRMEYYFSTFIQAIETKEYEKAYDMLYADFKDNYFSELSDFESYAREKFPKMMSVEHTNFERSGDVYILFVTINDALLGNLENADLEMKFIVKEEGINNFVMSFSVI